jgi:hypothetical protein
MDWKSQNRRICPETVQREPPERESSVFVFCRAWVRNQEGKAWAGLLVAEGHHGIDFAGAACGNIAGGERDQGEQDRDPGEG